MKPLETIWGPDMDEYIIETLKEFLQKLGLKSVIPKDAIEQFKRDVATGKNIVFEETKGSYESE